MELTGRYHRAVAYAAQVHHDQRRMGSNAPYLSHLLAVSGLVLEFGGTEDEAIAGLLHDALEDQPGRTSYQRIEAEFGTEVARIVLACSEVGEITSSRWRQRKAAYLTHLRGADQSVLRVSLADKLHNGRSMVTDLRLHGAVVWDRFNAGRADLLWFFGELATVFRADWSGDACWPLDFEAVVESMTTLGAG